EAWLRHWVAAVRARKQWSRRRERQLIQSGSELVCAVEHRVERDLLARVRRHASHAAHQARLNAALDLAVRLVVADRVDQRIPLILVWVACVGGLPDQFVLDSVVALVHRQRTATIVGPGCYGNSLW